MEFNKIIRGAGKAANTTDQLYALLDAGFLCHIGFNSEEKTMIIPTAYGRKDDYIFIHGSAKNHMLNEILNNQTVCISVTHLDGVVLARTLFDTSVNYRSAIIFGKAELITDETERLNGLEIITDNVIPGRWQEVSIGTQNELKATMVVKIKIHSASVKIRTDGPMGDESQTGNTWSGHIPLSLAAGNPVPDPKFPVPDELSQSVTDFINSYKLIS